MKICLVNWIELRGMKKKKKEIYIEKGINVTKNVNIIASSCN